MTSVSIYLHRVTGVSVSRPADNVALVQIQHRDVTGNESTAELTLFLAETEPPALPVDLSTLIAKILCGQSLTA